MQQLRPETIRELYPDRLTDWAEVSSVLTRLMTERISLVAGMNRAIEPERAYIESLGPEEMSIGIHGFEPRSGEIFFNFEFAERHYFVATRLLSHEAEADGWTLARVTRPTEIFLKERRGRLRSGTSDGTGWRVHVVGLEDALRATEAIVLDLSETGIGLSVSGDVAIEQGSGLSLKFLTGRLTGERREADVRHSTSARGWTRIGARLRSPGFQGAIPIQEAPSILPTSKASAAARSARLLASSVRVAATRVASKAGLVTTGSQETKPKVVRFSGADGLEIVGLVDSYLDARAPTAVIIPPAWGRTKETLLPLAKTLVATFRGSNQPLVVLRFDGVRKRGESFDDASEGSHHGFTVSQGIRDIEAAEQFLRSTFSPRRTVLVTFSAAGIDARAALARDGGARIDGWVCVVGPSDLQSALSVISGGIDYVGGGERGVRFGNREILGVEMDVDLANKDAAEHRLAFLEDACRDFEAISVPVTWLHGAHDAWMDLGRIRHAMSHGRQDNRKLVVIPTGHQLRTSREALDAFQLIAQEVSRMSLEVELKGRLPDLAELSAARAAERARLPERKFDAEEFWNHYLLGRDGNKGMDLMLESPSYLAMVQRQIDLLELNVEDTVLDLGCGTGVLVAQLAKSFEGALRVIGVDFVRGALRRFGELTDTGSGCALAAAVAADLSATHASLPIGTASVDVVVGSLLLSYVKSPEFLLSEIHRVLRPGGRLLVSSLRQDADFSKIWAHDERVLKARAREGATAGGEEQLTRSLQSFLNDAARVLDLEESGVFRFWEPEDLAELVEGAGFGGVRFERALGDPPQAAIVVARR